ncbi:MAG: HepT-like ribonuclease domain-containing protein [Cyanobacteria bacterium P01_H01_bin.130]
MSSRGDSDRLQDIEGAISSIERDTSGLNEEQFFSNQTKVQSVLYSLMVIGEAASKLSQEAKNMSPSTDWIAIKGLRNFIAHEYFKVKSDVIWDIITSELPTLKSTVESIKSEIGGT